MINKPNTPRNTNGSSPLGTYPGIFQRQTPNTARSGGCRSCAKSKYKPTLNTSGNKMTLSKEASGYLSSKARRMGIQPFNPPIQTNSGSILKVTRTQAKSTLQNYDTDLHPTNTPVPQRINPTNTKKLPHFDAPKIDDANWDKMVRSFNKPILILFSTPYCGACRDFKETTWQEAYWTYKDKVQMFEFECTPVTVQDKEHDALSHPTVVVYKDGKEVGVFLGHSIFQYFDDYLRRAKVI